MDRLPPSQIGRLQRWTRWSWIGLLVCALVLVPQTARPQADFSSLLKLIAPAVVQVETPAVGSGSGFVIEYRTPQGQTTWGIVTACHVVLQAPRAFGEAQAPATALVTFRAWEPEVRLWAAVVKCDAAHDAALLLPLDADGDIVPLPDFFRALAQERGDPSLLNFPRLWFGDSGAVGAFTPVFVIGYPGPYSEFNAVQGRISGRLPVLYVTAPDERIYRTRMLIIYDGAPDEELTLENILQIQILPALHLGELAGLAQRVLAAGHGLLLLSMEEPLWERETGWDVVGVEDGLVQVRERPVSFMMSFFGTEITIGPRLERRGTVSFEREFFRMDAPIAAGHSGAPVLNLSGQVVGMVEWSVSDMEGGHFINPGNVIRHALFEAP
jgi:S1-C subfamily serine protease